MISEKQKQDEIEKAYEQMKAQEKQAKSKAWEDADKVLANQQPQSV